MLWVGGMVDIAGFRALTYDLARVELSDVVTPPYDVIDAGLRAKLTCRSPYNFVHVDLPEPGPSGAPYRSAAERLGLWRAEGVLNQDPVPAVYRYHQVFAHPELGSQVTRRGVIVAAALSHWREGDVRPHETTFTAPREDRARLLDATRVHLSPVFSMYDGPGEELERMFDECPPVPDMAATTDDGTQHQLWRITAPDQLAKLTHLVSQKHAYVLDGHHRYETMVAFAEQERRRGGPGVQRGPMFLVPMDDPGLIILPTHRIVSGVPGLTRDRFLRDVQRHCAVQTITGAAGDAARLRQALHGARDVPRFVAVFPGDGDAHLLSVNVRGNGSSPEPEISIMHRLILDELLGIPEHERHARIRYVSNTHAALDQIGQGNGQLALIVRPPELTTIKQLADLGRVMPQKSTYFYPKLASGLIMMPIE